MKAYVSIGAIYRNEAHYLPEWLEFHRLMGVERFFLYNNRSTDNHLEVLAPYIEEGSVVWHDWPMFPGQYECYEHMLQGPTATTPAGSRTSTSTSSCSRPPVEQLPDVLRDFESYPGVVVNSIFYGTSFHAAPPDGPVVENYTRRLSLAAPRNRIVKSIVDPQRTVRVGNVCHYFGYGGKKAVNENFCGGGRGDARGLRRAPAHQPLLHPFGQERQEKLKRPGILHGHLVPNIEEVEERDRMLNQEVDEVLVPYGRAVRAALAARAAGTPLPVGSLETALGVASRAPRGSPAASSGGAAPSRARLGLRVRGAAQRRSPCSPCSARPRRRASQAGTRRGGLAPSASAYAGSHSRSGAGSSSTTL